jgi:hypothetical protein
LVVEILHFRHPQVELHRRLLADQQFQARNHVHQQLAVRADRLAQPLPRPAHLFLLLGQNLSPHNLSKINKIKHNRNKDEVKD